MKKNGLKVLSLSLLLSTLAIAGCSCSNDKPNVAEIEDGDFLSGLTDDASDYSLLDIYNAIIANDAANSAAAEELVNIVATTVLDVENPKSVWKEKYDAIVAKKLEELKESADYKVNGEFNEDYFVIALQAEGYNVTKTDYSDLINKKFRVEALSKLLKQKYIKEETLKDSKTTITNKKIRDVEYISVSSSLESTYKDYTITNNSGEEEDVDVNIRNIMREIRDEIAAAAESDPVGTIDFATFEARIKTELEGAVNGEFAKINTAKDYSQELAAKYTNNYTRSAEEGLAERLDEVAKLSFTDAKLISSDSANNVIISEAITSKLLSLANPENEEKRAIQIGDWYYLVSANAGATVDANDILLTETGDSSSYTYSIVRFKVINADNYGKNVEDRVLELLAESSSLASRAVSHYLEQYVNTITIYDDSVKEYLKNLYPEVFTE